ncbi:uncharacterized protein DUF3219 [Bacillus oleivorans]|uniref:Uncharacterized protein DUF3219 n=1 Tax=Bacillus oleivorans TaxID=1448271 RepID=A0A285CSW5_9BACI|nr:DUF3219 family protein [Bacillus oleivorans]SNX70657.1 uncharacterized protein DUF3219 [Bacillus oleivorans]
MEVLLNEVSIDAENIYINTITHKKTKEEQRVIGFEFNVISQEYHKITTLLYENDFTIKVPAKNLEFRGRINSYSTSITNLYNENETGVFKLELIEL